MSCRQAFTAVLQDCHHSAVTVTAFGNSVERFVELTSNGGLMVLQDLHFRERTYVNFDAGCVHIVFIVLFLVFQIACISHYVCVHINRSSASATGANEDQTAVLNLLRRLSFVNRDSAPRLTQRNTVSVPGSTYTPGRGW